jgi:hypothetical protein
VKLIDRYANSVIERLRELGAHETASVILIGSLARKAATWRSDIDILVITEEPIKRWLVCPEVHLHVETRSNFISKLQGGDDFPAGAIRLGTVLYDPSGWWARLAQSSDAGVWPSWAPKIRLAEKRLIMAKELLAIGDLHAAEEELLTAATHIARAWLLKRKMFPLSRPELPRQLSQGPDEKALGKFIERLMRGHMKAEDLQRAATFLSRGIEELKVAS